MEIQSKFTKKMVIKPRLREMQANESIIYPRTSYGSIRNALSTMKVEYPEKEYFFKVVEKGIEVTCLK